MSDDEFDEAKHEKLLASVLGRKEQVPIRKAAKKISSDVLINSVKKVNLAKSVAKQRLEQEEKDKKRVGASETIAVPVHRQASERIKGAVGYIELKKDLNVWNDVVKSNRLADQIVFPLGEERLLSTEKPADRAEAFKPKTDFEKKMMNMWSGSKNNMTNDTVYTEAELEIIRAMDFKEAKEKLSQMQKMRALISYREAKYRYAAKIKSKGYHRLLKRQKRKQLIKEFDDLLVRDPEAAKEKLQELENQRIIERGSLKHRARTKFQQDIVKYAGRDAKAKQVLEEHLRIGRDLKSKVSMESDSEDEEDADEQKKMSVSDMIKSAALAAGKSTGEEGSSTAVMNEDEARTALYELRAKKRKELEAAKSRAVAKPMGSSALFEQDSDWSHHITGAGMKAVAKEAKEEEATQLMDNEEPNKGKRRRKAKRSKEDSSTEEQKSSAKDIDKVFDAAEEKIVENLKELAREIRMEEQEKETGSPNEKKKKLGKKKKVAEEKKDDIIDISLDPENFLQAETTNLTKVSAELMEKMDEFDQDQAQAIAEAFKDDDVVGNFEEDKMIVEEGERPKDVDLTLQGWGCWVGPGMTERQRRKKFIVKARQKKRKDASRPGVIIKEIEETSISKLQPSSLPFPYSSVVDFETMVSQPIGKDWNPMSVVQDMCKPAVITQGGRSIRPMNKSDVLAGKLSLDE
ncbi:hypothetical protein Q1695_009432 [Nippostrongylus brasiliensis]|nr:hypothetical protein Q1695_009432 [Nippostrongylus brasiliensis]